MKIIFNLTAVAKRKEGREGKKEKWKGKGKWEGEKKGKSGRGKGNKEKGREEGGCIINSRN